MNNNIKIRRYLTGSLIDFRRDFYKYITELFEQNKTDLLEIPEEDLFVYMMKKFRGGCSPTVLLDEIRNIKE